ncbi:MAG: hypothetical protein Mars2KO_40780 [Maribacter sp.]
MAQVPKSMFKLAKIHAGAKYLGFDKMSLSDFMNWFGLIDSGNKVIQYQDKLLGAGVPII